MSKINPNSGLKPYTSISSNRFTVYYSKSWPCASSQNRCSSRNLVLHYNGYFEITTMGIGPGVEAGQRSEGRDVYNPISFEHAQSQILDPFQRRVPKLAD